MLLNNLQRSMNEKGVTIYRLSKLTGIRYELLRRTFRRKRKLLAEEFVLICEKTDIKMDDLKKDDSRRQKLLYYDFGQPNGNVVINILQSESCLQGKEKRT